MEQRGYPEGSVEFHQLALGDASTDGQVKMFFGKDPLPGIPDAPVGTLGWSSEFNLDSEMVNITSLDRFRARHGLETERVFMLKVDCEGYDPAVLRGARRLLSRQHVEFVLFEYGALYLTARNSSSAPDSLEGTAEWLDALGYDSYLLGRNNAIRVNGNCWRQDYELWLYSDVERVFFCNLSELADGERRRPVPT